MVWQSFHGMSKDYVVCFPVVVLFLVLFARTRNGIERSRVRRKSVWLWCQTIIALVILFGLLLFLVLQMFEYRILDGYGASWYGNSVPFVSYHHYGTPPT